MSRSLTLRKRFKGDEPKQKFSTLEEEEIIERIRLVKASRGKGDIELQTKQVIYHLMLMLKGGVKMDDVKFSEDKTQVIFKSPEKMACKLTGLGKDTIRGIMNDFDKTMHENGSMISVTAEWGRRKQRGNFKPKKTTIKRTQHTRKMVQKFLRNKRKDWERCCTADVAKFLTDKGMLRVSEGGWDSARVTTWRYLKAQGFKFRASKACLADHVKRDEYLVAIKENRALPAHSRLREVYLDESYIHNHHNQFHMSLYDPFDELDDSTGPPHKGQRLCIVAAIQMESLRKNKPNPHAGLVPGSEWYFQPKPTKDGKEHEGDYHKNFNRTNFLWWMQENLLPNLHEKSIIILDNAKYHKCYSDDVSEYGKWNKAKCITFLRKKTCKTRSHGKELTKLSAKDLKARVRDYIKANEKMMITKVCEEKGHKVLFTPPRYSDLQPIELVWANIKYNIGRNYSRGTTMKVIEKRLENEFKKILDNGSELISGIIRATNRKFYKFCKDAFGDKIPKQFRDRNDDTDYSDDDDEDSDYSDS